ncbi:MAG: DUF6508 domain-containing protein [Anaerolineae bacterium]|nr:DUF6508 domain-containing protein [Anaerolineae bacterium]
MPPKLDIPPVSHDQLDAVLRYLPVFEQPGYQFGEWHMPEGQFPYYAMEDEVIVFLQTLYDQDIIYVFDWGKWQDNAQALTADPALLQQADLLTLRQLLTTHVRMDRFVEGHLGAMFENGLITAVLHRLQEIRQAM